MLKLAFIWSLVGIIILIAIAWFTEPVLVEIGSLENEVGKTVVVQGEVTDTSYKSKVTFFEIDDGTGKVTAVLFKLPTEYIEKGDKIQIKGKAEYYKGELEIVADEVKCLEC